MCGIFNTGNRAQYSAQKLACRSGLRTTLKTTGELRFVQKEKHKQHGLKGICKLYNYFASNNLIINTIIITIQETYWFLCFLKPVNTAAGIKNRQRGLPPVSLLFGHNQKCTS